MLQGEQAGVTCVHSFLKIPPRWRFTDHKLAASTLFPCYREAFIQSTCQDHQWSVLCPLLTWSVGSTWRSWLLILPNALSLLGFPGYISLSLSLFFFPTSLATPCFSSFMVSFMIFFLSSFKMRVRHRALVLETSPTPFSFPESHYSKSHLILKMP